MTKKHLIALADYLRDTDGYCRPFTDHQLAHLANFCHSQNANFNRTRWLAYIAGECGPSGGSVKTNTATPAPYKCPSCGTNGSHYCPADIAAS